LAAAVLCGCKGGEERSGGRGPAEPKAVTEAKNDSSFRLATLPSQQDVETTTREARPTDWFEDVTAQSGLEFTYSSGSEVGLYTMLETLGGGVAMLDYDRDGDIDLLFPGGGSFSGNPVQIKGSASALFRNEGQWRFTDVSDEAGFNADDLYTHGCAVGDYDRDGFPDLIVTGYGGCRLYRNHRGERFIDETTSAGIDCPGWSVAVAWADYDHDGWLDLYIAKYVKWQLGAKPCFNVTATGRVRDICGPHDFPPDRDQLWRNLGNGSFEEVTAAAGLAQDHRGLGIVAADLDENGWIDFFVVNDLDPNDLYLGGPELPFESVGALAGVAYDPLGFPEGSMGVDVGDFDGDGQADLFYTNYVREDNTLLRKTDPRGFVNVSNSAGITGSSRSLVGWGTGFTDFDNDGWQDLFIVNGNLLYEQPRSPFFQPSQLLRNQEGIRFQEVSEQAGPYFSVPHAARGAAVGDLDNDGALDLVIVHQDKPAVLLRNLKLPEHWVRVRLRGTASNPDAIGAKLTVPYGERILTRWRRGGGGYLSQFDPRIVIPLPNKNPIDVTVRWPSGKSEAFFQLAQGETHELVEGEAAGQPSEGQEPRPERAER
jgi:hypothetical protein